MFKNSPSTDFQTRVSLLVSATFSWPSIITSLCAISKSVMDTILAVVIPSSSVSGRF